MFLLTFGVLVLVTLWTLYLIHQFNPSETSSIGLTLVVPNISQVHPQDDPIKPTLRRPPDERLVTLTHRRIDPEIIDDHRFDPQNIRSNPSATTPIPPILPSPPYFNQGGLRQ